jgi:NADPH:quinone reductase
MRAVICRAWGPVEDLTLETVDPPVPGARQVLIDVEATGVNYADAIMVAGQYQTRPAFPFSPGLETAGVVAGCGAEVVRYRPGDRVMAILPHGGFAEQAVAEEAETFPMPAGISFEEAGAFPVAYISSHVAIRWQGRLEAGETLLVQRGADALVNYVAERLTDRIMALTDGRGADVCFDPVGGDLFDAALSSLGWGGRMLLVGFVGGIPSIPANRLLVQN